jgi:hypothetical protein
MTEPMIGCVRYRKRTTLVQVVRSVNFKLTRNESICSVHIYLMCHYSISVTESMFFVLRVLHLSVLS